MGGNTPKERRRPRLWQQDELDAPWFQQPLVDEALRIAAEQERRGTKTVPPRREALETDPALDGWFEK